MIVKEKIYIDRDINYPISGDFWINGVTGTKGRVRASDPGFVFNATIYEDVTKIEYEYNMLVKEPKILNGEFTIITDREDIKIPYEFNLFSNTTKISEDISLEDVTPEIFITEQFGKRYAENSKARILWEAYRELTVNESNINEFFIAIGDKKRKDDKHKELKKIVTKTKDARYVYADIQKLIFRYSAKIDTETIFLEGLKKAINKLKTFEEPEYRIKSVEYLWAYHSKDELRCDYIFDTLEDKFNHDDKFFDALYMYIKAIHMNTESEINEAANKLEIRSYELDLGIIYWFCYKLRARQNKTANELYIWLKKIVSLGCNSPFIYMELHNIIEKYDTAILKTDYIEVRVLYWAYRKKILSEKIVEYIINKTNYVSGYYSQLFHILTDEFRKRRDIKILQVICSLLIHGNRMDKTAFLWYRLGVENKIRLTSLFEYFLYSMPNCYSELLPNEIYIYFRDNKMLTDKNKQSLYYNIIKNYNNITHIYDHYKSDMNAYALKALRERRISDELVEIYNEFPTGIIMDKVLSHCLLNIYCAFRFICKDDRIRKLIIVQSRLSNLIEVWPINMIADARIPDSNFLILAEYNDDTIVLADSNIVEYKRIMFLNSDVKNAFNIGKNHIVALMENKNPSMETLEEINKKKWLRSYYKKDIQTKLIKYYALNDEISNHILDFDIDLIENKNELISEYIKIGEYKVALQSLIQEGFDIIDNDEKLNLFNGIISEGYVVSDLVRDLALHLYFNGVRDFDLVMFLYQQHELTLEDEIENYDMLRFNLINDREFYEKIENYCEFLLNQNGEFGNSKLYIHLWEKRDELSAIKLLEMLRRFSCENDYTDEIRMYVSEQLEKLVSIGMYPEWFMRFKSKGLLPFELSDKTILTFKNHGVFVYKYKGEKDSLYKEVELKKITDSIYVVAIPMFYGDTIIYKIYDPINELFSEEYAYTNNKRTKHGIYKDGFDRLNDIIYAKSNDLPELSKLIGEYKGMKDMALDIFKPRV